MPAPQTYRNYTRFDPLFHFILAPLLIANIVFVSIWYAHHRSQHAHIGPWAIVMSVALLLMLERVRGYAIKNQDRIILLEERLRYAMLLTPELAAMGSAALTKQQMIALRFAGDGEFPALLERAVRERLAPKQIKQSITDWRGDYNRV